MNYKAKCAIGKRGIGNKRKEGDLITPKGKYKIKYILYRKDRIKRIQSKIRSIIISWKLIDKIVKMKIIIIIIDKWFFYIRLIIIINFMREFYEE